MGPTALTSAADRAGARWSLELESLRGIAIVLVVLFHARGVIGVHPPAVGEQASAPLAFGLAGHTGVTLFFVLSGYLLAPAFVAEARGGGHVDRREFFIRRALRILPLYYLFVVLGSVMTASAPADVLRGVPYLFFLNAWPLPNVPANLWPWSGVWWSLATEVQFYLVLPLLALVGRRRFGGKVLGILLVLYGAAYVAAVSGALQAWPVPWRIRLFASVFGRAPAFAFGALAALTTAPLQHWLARRSGGSARRWLVPEIFVIGILGALAALLQFVAARGYVPMELDYNAWHLVEAALWSGLVLLLVAAPLRGKILLSNPVLGALGRWSYSLYLIHYPIISFTFAGPDAILRQVPLPQPVAVALPLLTAVGLSAATYHFFERRFIRHRKPAGDSLSDRSRIAA